MLKSLSPLFALALTTTLFLGGCADPSDKTPDAEVRDVPAVEAPAAEAPAADAPVAETPAPAAEVMEGTTYTIAPSSTVAFVGSKLTGSHDGGFKTVNGAITIPGDDLTKATIVATIDMKSAYSDNEKLTEHLLSADFFDAEIHPESKFESTGIAATDAGFDITGTLTFHGVTKSITFPATMKVEEGVFTADAEFDINRFDFGVKYPGKADDAIRENVVIKLHIEGQA